MKPIPHSIVLAAQAAQHVTGVLASVQLAQYGLESAWGSRTTGSYNYFGIKGTSQQDCRMCETHEVVDGKPYLTHALFRNFASPAQAFMAHAELLATAPDYAAAMKHAADPVAFVRLIAPHYATDPQYADKLLNLIEGDGLHGYDIALKAAA